MKINASSDTISLGTLVTEEPCYGTSATAFDRISEDQAKYIRITDFNDYGIEDNHEFKTPEFYSKKHILKNGDILFARTGGTVGKTYYYDKSIGKAVFAGYCIRFRFDESKVIPKYVYWYTKTNTYLNWVKGIQRPSGQPNINKEEYKSFEIVLPQKQKQIDLVENLEEQFAIRNEKIKKAEKQIIENKKGIENRFNLNQSENKLCFAVRFKKIDGVIDVKRYSTIGNVEHKLTISDLCDVVDERVNVSSFGNCIVDWIRIDDLQNQPLDIEQVRTMPATEIDGTFFEVQKDDILVARLGPTILNQKIVMVRNIERTTIASSEFLVLRCKKAYNPEAVMSILKTDYYMNLMYSNARGSTPSRYRLNRSDMLKLPFPDIADVQDEIAENAISARETAKKLRVEAEQEWQAAKAQFEKELLGE